MINRTGYWIVLCCIVVLSGILPAQADLIAPAITHVYFEKNGTPYNGNVDYSVNCYGYMKPPFSPQTTGFYKPERVFSYSASCNGYVCVIYQPYYLQYTHIDWCDLEGEADNQIFTVQNFSTEPYTRCDSVPNRVSKTNGNNREYYYETPEYFSCRQFETNEDNTVWVDRLNFSGATPVNSSYILSLSGLSLLYETPDWSHLIINKTDISLDLNEYIHYLETCDPTTDKKCPGWIINGTPLKSFTEYRTLKNNTTDLKEHPCDTFLITADPSLIMPFTDHNPWSHACVYNCNYTMEICESRFSIPSGNLNVSATQDRTTVQGTTTPAATTLHNPALYQTMPAVSRSPVESLYCGIMNFFGARC
jgi:hypothetical protein